MTFKSCSAQEHKEQRFNQTSQCCCRSLCASGLATTWHGKQCTLLSISACDCCSSWHATSWCLSLPRLQRLWTWHTHLSALAQAMFKSSLCRSEQRSTRAYGYVNASTRFLWHWLGTYVIGSCLLRCPSTTLWWLAYCSPVRMHALTVILVASAAQIVSHLAQNISTARRYGASWCSQLVPVPMQFGTSNEYKTGCQPSAMAPWGTSYTPLSSSWHCTLSGATLLQTFAMSGKDLKEDRVCMKVGEFPFKHKQVHVAQRTVYCSIVAHR
jgi:hypothetical protein